MADDVAAKGLWETLKEPQMIISLWITGQFFLLIVGFGCGVLKLANDTTSVVLQTYIVAFTAAWGYWLGSSSGSKAKDVLKGVTEK